MTDQEMLEDERDPGGLDLALWRRILAHARPYRGPLLGLMLSGVVAAVTDVLMPLVTGRIIDSATLSADRGMLVANILVYLALVIVLVVVIWYFIVAAGKAATGYAHDLRRAAFARLQELSFSFFDRRPVGWLMARLTSDCARLSSLLPWFLLDCTWGSFLLVGISIVMLVLNWKLAILVMAIIPPLAVTSVIFQRKLLRTQRLVRRTNSQITASYNEGIMGVRTSKTLVREEENLEEFQGLSAMMYRQSVRNALLAAVYLPIVLTFGALGVGMALWRGGLDVAAAGSGLPAAAAADALGGAGTALAGLAGAQGMSLGTLIAFMQYAALFYIPVQEMAARFTELQAAQASAERLQGLLDTEPEIQDSDTVRDRLRSADGGPVPVAGAGTGDSLAADGHDARIEWVEFDRVSFAYGEESDEVLTDFDLRVEAGETIALVGATGSGKTTIVSLLCRFYEPTRGTIRINGVDYRERSLAWLQSQLGIVLQAPHLFSGSIRDNIRYGRLEATDEEVEAAARVVGADTFIAELEGGFDSDVGEGGIRLSTGQKQLVSLARAILADPQIFVLDEATSSVDAESERLIQQGIERVLAGRLSFVIAHRLSTIRSADRILVIDGGRLIEAGSHDALMRARGHYCELYTNQFAREREQRLLRGNGAA